LPPMRPPLAPCSRKNSRTSDGNFLIVPHILTPFWSLALFSCSKGGLGIMEACVQWGT
jgi:hypothetical protein